MRSAILFWAAMLVVLVAPAAKAATFTVSSAADSGPATLRQAILDANATPERDRIVFALSGATVIQPVGTDETPAPADFTIRSDIAALAALMAGGPVRRHRFRGRLRIEGRYRGARSLQAIARAEVTLGRLRDTGLAPDPLLVARALAVIGLDA